MTDKGTAGEDTADKVRPTGYVAARLTDYIGAQYRGIELREHHRGGLFPEEGGYATVILECWLSAKPYIKTSVTVSARARKGDSVEVTIAIDTSKHVLTQRLNVTSKNDMETLFSRCCEVLIQTMGEKIDPR
jgi:hypothetical protein